MEGGREGEEGRRDGRREGGGKKGWEERREGGKDNSVQQYKKSE